MRTPESTATAVGEQIRPVVQSDERVLFVYLFGSVASGDARVDSDVDLAVYPSETLSLLDEAALHERLARTLTSSVDLVMLNRAPLWLQFRILGEGCVVFSRDESARIAFRAWVEKAFLDFRPLHDAYLAAVRHRARRGELSLG